MKNIYYSFKECILKYGKKWDKMAPNKKNAIAFANNKINIPPKKYKLNGEFSKEYIIVASSETINGRFRDDDDQHVELAKYIGENYSLKENLVVYRGVSESVYKKMESAADGIRNVDLLEKGFLNTSIVKGHELEAYKHLRIYIPKDTTAFYAGDINSEESIFYEVIVQIGARLKIISKDSRYINCKLIETYLI